jgi:hypothetical protein
MESKDEIMKGLIQMQEENSSVSPFTVMSKFNLENYKFDYILQLIIRQIFGSLK